MNFYESLNCSKLNDQHCLFFFFASLNVGRFFKGSSSIWQIEEDFQTVFYESLNCSKLNDQHCLFFFFASLNVGRFLKGLPLFDNRGRLPNCFLWISKLFQIEWPTLSLFLFRFAKCWKVFKGSSSIWQIEEDFQNVFYESLNCSVICDWCLFFFLNFNSCIRFF